MARKRGEGSLFQRLPSKNWFIGYYRPDGKRVKESTGTENETEARKILRARLAAGDAGEIVATGRVKVKALYEDLRQQVEAERNSRGSRALEELGWRWNHLSPVFGHLRAAALTTQSLVAYQVRRQREGDADATINRELACLRRMLYYGIEMNRIKAMPCTVPMIPENNTRQGFVEDADFELLAAAAEELWLRTFLELAYSYGWRKSEILGLRVRQVNLRNGTIRLNPGTTKNKAGREVTCTEKVAELLSECVAGKDKDDYVLTRASGKRVKEFRGAWKALFLAAGVEERLPHDLRRSAAKAGRRAGIPETVIMSMGGWKTRKVFERYAIVSASDQREAVKMLEAARSASRALGPVLVPDLKKADEKVG